MANFNIQTAQNVTISQNLAGIGQRFAAFFIDTVFLVLFYFFMFWLLNESGILDKFSSWAFVAVLSLPHFLYFPLIQYWNNGQSLGKQLVKIRVVKVDNSHPRLGDFIIRWALRLFEVDAFGGIALISVLLSPKRQRLGDMLAKTTVVSEQHKVKLTHTIFEDIQENYQPVFNNVVNFQEKDIKLIKNVFEEAKSTKNASLLRKLSNKIEVTMGTPRPEGMPFVKFIDTVLKDYNYFAGK